MVDDQDVRGRLGPDPVDIPHQPHHVLDGVLIAAGHHPGERIEHQEPHARPGLEQGDQLLQVRVRVEQVDAGQHEIEARGVALHPQQRLDPERHAVAALGPRAITEFNYRYAKGSDARIFVGINLPGGKPEKRDLIAALESAGYRVADMSDNEMAKVHVRYMVGGRASGLADERLYRFQFPERPGALMKFLEALGDGFNISLFHYRNHGADYGRVLAGIEVPAAERDRFDAALEALAYPYVDETDNPAYRLFLDNGIGAEAHRHER